MVARLGVLETFIWSASRGPVSGQVSVLVGHRTHSFVILSLRFRVWPMPEPEARAGASAGVLNVSNVPDEPSRLGSDRLIPSGLTVGQMMHEFPEFGPLTPA